jgi:uncharacterized coiled-coil protein SlyX
MLALSLSGGAALATPPEKSEASQAATPAEVAELIAAAEVTIARVSEQLDLRIQRMGSELYSRTHDLEIAKLASTEPSGTPTLHCMAMPDGPMTCAFAHPASR